MRKLAVTPTMIAALVVSALVSLVDVVHATAPSDAWESAARWQTLKLGLVWASSLLFAAGWSELARRAAGRTRTLFSLVALSSWAPVIALVAHEVAQVIVPDPREFLPVVSVISVASSAIYLAAAVLVTIAASAWRKARVAAVVAAVVAIAVPVTTLALIYIPSTFRWMDEHHAAMAVLFAGLKCAQLVAYFHLAEQSSGALPAPAPSLADARIGFMVAGGSLWIRIVVVLGILSYARATTAWAWAPIAVVASSATLLGFAWGALRAVRSRVPGLPRARLVVGSACVAWWASVHLAHAFTFRRLETFGLEAYATTFSLVAPLVGLAGMMLVVSAAISLASARADDRLREQLMLRGIAMTVLLLASLGLSGQFDVGFQHRVAALVSTLLGTAALASACTRAAKGLEHEHVVPSARALG